MSDVLLFLGAGASTVFDVPSMKAFVEKLGEAVLRERKQDSPFYTEIVDHLRPIYGESLDLEAILDTIAGISARTTTEEYAKRTAPRLAYRLTRLKEGNVPGMDHALTWLDAQLDGGAGTATDLLHFTTDYIRSVCGHAKLELAAETYRSLLLKVTRAIAAGAVDGEHAIVPVGDETALRTGERVITPYLATTNYDLCFEAFCSRYSVNYVNGFSHSRSEHEFDFDPELFDQRGGIHLLKLHGSIDWWKTHSNRVIETQHATVGKNLRSLDTVSEMCIRYPVNDKQLFEYPFLELYSRLGRYLNRARVWLFIGYRFGDPSIRNMVVDLARQDKKVIVVAPTADSILLNDLKLADKVPTYAIRLKFPYELVYDQIQAALRDRPDAAHRQLRLLS